MLAGQHDAVGVVVLLDGGSGDARQADAVAAHHDGLLLAVLVEERRRPWARSTWSELEDVADLDDARALEVAGALRARVAGARLAQVGEGGLRHQLERDAGAVVAVLVGAGDVVARRSASSAYTGSGVGAGPT